MTIRVGLADGHDPRVEAAARQLAADGRVRPVLVGQHLPNLDGVDRVAPPPGIPDVEHLATLLAAGEVAAGVSGSVTTSARVVRSGIRNLGTGGLVSGAFAIQHDGGWKTYADCVVVPTPDAAQLADIAATAADHHRAVFAETPRVAMLSFSTGGSAEHPRVSLVREATDLLRTEHPDLLVEGEVQYDVAIDPEVAARKAPESRVAGQANVLVFPSLEAANIAYKVAERVGRTRALGSFLLGLSHPWADLSRGCSTADIVDTVLLLSGNRPDPHAADVQPAAS